MLPLVRQMRGLGTLPSRYHRHSHPHRSLISSSFKLTEETADSRDTFGRLAMKHKQAHSRDKESASIDLSKSYRGALKPLTEASEFSQESMLEKWHKFKSVQDQENPETLRRSGGQQDDAEEDYHLFLANRSVRSQGQETPQNKKLHKKVIKSAADTYGGVGPPRESPEGEVFGHLTPKYEVPEDDDGGDLREEKYQDAKLGRRHRPQFYGMRMKQLCRERKLAEAIKILEDEMPAAAVKPNDFCYQVLINACGRAGYTKKAFQLYNQMKKRGLKVQPVAYTGLFNACANSPWPDTDGLQRAKHLRTELIGKGYLFNQIISHAMIKAFGRCGDIGTAFLVVDEMVQDGLLVTTETLNFLLQACITDKEAGFRHAVKVWRKMRELKLQPDIYSYNLLTYVIKDCGAGDHSLTSSLLEDDGDLHNPGIKGSQRKKQLPGPEPLVLKEPLHAHESHAVNVPEDTVVSSSEKDISVQRLDNTAGESVLPNILGKKMTAGNVVALGALDNPQDRLVLLGGPTGILRQMVKDRVTPDLKTFTQLLDSLPPDTQAEEALVESMKNVGLEPDTQFFNMLIKRRNFRRDTEAAQEVLTLMQEHHLVPDLITYGCLALGCHNTHSARQLLKDMDATQFRPSLEIMASLVKNSLVKQDYAFTAAVLKEMQQRGTTPNDFLLSQLEQARTRARKTLLLKHDGSAKNQERRKRSAELFLAAYKMWLMGSQVQLPEHPWAQYQ